MLHSDDYVEYSRSYVGKRGVTGRIRMPGGQVALPLGGDHGPEAARGSAPGAHAPTMAHNIDHV